MDALLVSILAAQFVLDRGGGFVLHLDIEAKSGETLVLLGPNGSGKSTVVAAISGLLRIDEGKIALGDRVFDEPASGSFIPPEARSLGVVFQDYVLFPRMSVLENVAFGPRAQGIGKERSRSQAEEWLDAFGLAELASSRADGISGGEAQRIALARALATNPDVLLLDEPTSALDISIRPQVREMLARVFSEFEGPRILITHDPTEAFLLGDRIVIIEDGEVTHAGPPDEIRMSPRTRYAAELAGVNLFEGRASAGRLDVEGHSLVLADPDLEGAVVATIAPTAISVHVEEPSGSARNSWPTNVVLLEAHGSRARLRTGPPLGLTVELTVSSVEALGLVPGADIWVSIKATEIETSTAP